MLLFVSLAVGIFADGQYGAGWNGTETDSTAGVTGILYGGNGFSQLAAQAVGVVVILQYHVMLLREPRTLCILAQYWQPK